MDYKTIANALHEAVENLCDLTEKCTNNCVGCPLFIKGECIIDCMAYARDNCCGELHKKG